MAVDGVRRPRLVAAILRLVACLCLSLLCGRWLARAQASAAYPAADRSLEGTVAFASVGRSHFAFDIFSIALPLSLSAPPHHLPLPETLLTDGVSVNYNGHFSKSSDAFSCLHATRDGGYLQQPSTDDELLVFVSERTGSAEIYWNPLPRTRDSGGATGNSGGATSNTSGATLSASLLHPQAAPPHHQNHNPTSAHPSLRDRPSLVGRKLIYASTQEPSGRSRQSWAAIFATDLRAGTTIRLTPPGVADFSPSVSPDGAWIAAASDSGNPWDGEIHELATDLVVFSADDGSNRRLVAVRAGWPSWADASTLYFHRRAEDGWWSIFRVVMGAEGGGVERVTPPGVHAFTPAASPTGKWLAVATRRPECEFRHVEIFDLASKSFIKITERITPHAHHYNPFVSPNSGRVGYHKCRGSSQALASSSFVVPHLEHIQSPLPRLAIVRIDGAFPAFSPDGSLVAFIPALHDGGVYVTNLNGRGKRKIFSGVVFGLAWDKAKKGVLYTSYGQFFAHEDITVHIIAISNAHEAFSESSGPFPWKQLTKDGTGNNAFPAPSPDGRWVVFRSGRSGHKNLYIMDAVDGEEGGIRRLTEGPWTDTMASWSHDGEWIAFSSDRENPGSGSFSLYFIHPDGTGLHRVLSSGGSHKGRLNHPFFSPDSKSLVFTSDIAGISAEPISVPHQFQPYGEIFIAKIDGTDVTRLTHNAYEDGTPSWGPLFLNSSLLTSDGEVLSCDFDDVTWLKQQKAPIASRC